jgi:hypothetical protein
MGRSLITNLSARYVGRFRSNDSVVPPEHFETCPAKLLVHWRDILMYE